jgi:hypothetical protein
MVSKIEGSISIKEREVTRKAKECEFVKKDKS